MSGNPICSRCGGETVKAGFQTKSKNQVYKCKDCGFRSTYTKDKGGGQRTQGEFCTDCGIPETYARDRCEKCYRRYLKRNSTK